MATIVTRSGKGSPLTSTEVDTNFTNLNTDKQEILSEGVFVDGDKTKLDGIEASADVTDTTNVTGAGALMDSEVANLAQVKAFDSSDYATSTQGATADSALQNVVEDTTPQLGGDLDVNSKNLKIGLSSTSFLSGGSGDKIEFQNSGTTFGQIYAGTAFGYDILYLDNTASSTGMIVHEADFQHHFYIGSASKFYVNNSGVTVTGDIAVTGNVDGKDVSTLLADVVDDTTPQLGGDLDANGNDIKLDANEKIYFGDSDDPDANWIGYNTANNNLQFQATSSNGGWEFDPQNGGTYSFKLSAPSGAGGWAIDVLGNSTGGTITTNYSNSSNPVYFQKNGTTKISFLNTGAVRLENLDINGAYTLPTSDGTNGQVLTTDGAGAVTFADASGGGGGGSSGETLMSSGTVTNVSSIDFDSSVLTGYESYRIVLSNVTPTVDARELRMRVGTANTALTSGIYQQSVYQYGMRTTGSQLSTSQSSASNSFFWLTTNTNGMGLSTGENCYAEIYLPNPNSTTGYKHAVCRVSNFSYYPAIMGQRISAMAARTQSALNFVTFYSEQGNIATATYRLYGYS